MTTTATIEQLLSALSKRRGSQNRLFSRSCGRRRSRRHRTLQPDRLNLDWISRGNSRGIQNGSNLNCRHGCIHCLSLDISRDLDIDGAIGSNRRIPGGVLNHRLSSLHTLEGFEAASPHIDDITNSHSLNIRLCVDLTSQAMCSGGSHRNAGLGSSLALDCIGVCEISSWNDDRGRTIFGDLRSTEVRGHAGRHLSILEGLCIGAANRIRLSIRTGRNIKALIAQAHCARVNGGSHHRRHRRLGRWSAHGSLRRDTGCHGARPHCIAAGNDRAKGTGHVCLGNCNRHVAILANLGRSNLGCH